MSDADQIFDVERLSKAFDEKGAASVLMTFAGLYFGASFPPDVAKGWSNRQIVVASLEYLHMSTLRLQDVVLAAEAAGLDPIEANANGIRSTEES